MTLIFNRIGSSSSLMTRKLTMISTSSITALRSFTTTSTLANSCFRLSRHSTIPKISHSINRKLHTQQQRFVIQTTTATRGRLKNVVNASLTKRVTSSSSTSMVSIEHQKLITSIIKDGYPFMYQSIQNQYGHIGKWILTTSGLVILMIHIGGITRLTQSGLSMTDWSITGTLPPISYNEWMIEFNKYKLYPEYQQRKSMTLTEFQYIYFWEYAHRMFGRFIGIAFIGPWMYYTIRKQIPIGYQYRMILLGSMGLTQGLVGWWMVKSGLTNDRFNDTNEIRVKPIRLATHLSMAVITYSTLLWTAFDIFQLPNQNKMKDIITNLASSMNTTSTTTGQSTSYIKDIIQRTIRFKYGCIGFVTLSGFTIVSGALVAGNDAGRAYNTFPKMNDEWIPSNYIEDTIQPIYRNIYENTATVQFNHRLLGISTACTGLYLSISSYIAMKPILLLSSSSITSSLSSSTLLLTPQVRKALIAIGITSIGQSLLGITTLLTYVPISLAALHQIGSIIVLTSGIYLVHSMKYITKRMITQHNNNIIPKNSVITTATNTAITTTTTKSLTSSLK